MLINKLNESVENIIVHEGRGMWQQNANSNFLWVRDNGQFVFFVIHLYIFNSATITTLFFQLGGENLGYTCI